MCEVNVFVYAILRQVSNWLGIIGEHLVLEE